MRIYLQNIPAEFHPDPIAKDGALGFLTNFAPTIKQEQQEDE